MVEGRLLDVVAVGYVIRRPRVDYSTFSEDYNMVEGRLLYNIIQKDRLFYG